MNIKLGPNATMPTKANPSDAGFDLTSTGRTKIGNILSYETEVYVAIPEGHVGLLFPRSSIYKKDLEMCNSVGVIDAGYRGQIIVKFREIPTNDVISNPKIYNVGDRIAQLVIVPIAQIELKQVEDLDSSDRREGGFGSSGE